MIELDISKTYALLKECVKEKGEDYVYASPDGGGCTYVHGTELVSVGSNDYGQPIEEEQVTGELTPGCLVGTVLVKAGLSPQVFVDLGINRETSSGGALIALMGQGHISMDEGQYYGISSILGTAQNLQDRGHTWGEALEGVKPELRCWSDDEPSV